ncbi:hypothetical protein VZC37_12660 [Gordonia sp. LSe1-13]|uniref:Transcriptional regulator, AbiEi antitoxin, Type IV TA system n=1 Tax=Gordonia sesuvii TaxID=3116777 RepID=A0ABU7MDM1_9ACTN|nr:hypothetical protein [Gordonia sp. LSe1-13]
MENPHIGADDLVFRSDAVVTGTTDSALSRRVRNGAAERVWHGAYLPVSGEPMQSHTAKLERYRATVIAASRNGGPARTVSHISAAIMHRVPLLRPDLTLVHFTSATTGKRIRRGIIHQSALSESDIVCIGGVRVTSLARTLCDVARTGTLAQAVCALDSGLHLGVAIADLQTAAEQMRRHRGIAMLRSALAVADGRSESIGESVSRLGLSDSPLIPKPELQVRIPVSLGGRTVVVRGDFGWRDEEGRLRLVGEFDGRFKYHRSNPFGDNRLPEEVIYEEKLREDAIRDAGPHVVRWTWSDAHRPHVLHPKVLAGLRTAGIVG